MERDWRDLPRTCPPEELLGRSEISVDEEMLRGSVEGRRFLVTGGAGSIGAELCRRLGSLGAGGLVIVDHDESALFRVSNQIRGLSGEVDLRAVLCDIRDRDAVDAALDVQEVHAVFHAAAYKHVPMMERQPIEAVTNNIFGTRNVVRSARAHGVSAFLMVSSDKADRPVNVLGATKRAAELVVAESAADTTCRYGSVRLGNVLGSRGSVVPVFAEQIACGGPVTLTHPEARRVFLSLREAGLLILRASLRVSGGEVYALDTGLPVLIRDVAARMIRSSGRDIEIETTGLREGERLVEEPLTDRPDIRPTSEPYVLRCETTPPAPGSLGRFLDELKLRIRERDAEGVRMSLKRFIY